MKCSPPFLLASYKEPETDPLLSKFFSYDQLDHRCLDSVRGAVVFLLSTRIRFLACAVAQ